jgi:aspartyl-tRNA synthetase
VVAGLDRLLAIMVGAKSIREVIAFPKNAEAKDTMGKSPAAVSQEALNYYHIECKVPPKTS